MGGRLRVGARVRVRVRVRDLHAKLARHSLSLHGLPLRTAGVATARPRASLHGGLCRASPGVARSGLT